MSGILRPRLAVPVLVLSIVAAGLSAYLFSMVVLDRPGLTGSAHRHLFFRVDVFGQRVDFSSQRFQLRSQKVHFEGGNGEILHVHADNVDIRYTLRTLGFGLTSDCLTYGRQAFCTNSTHVLQIWVDGHRVEAWGQYDLRQGDNILIRYARRGTPVDDRFMTKILPPAYRPRIPGRML